MVCMSKRNEGAGISRADVEKALWQLTSWQGDQVVIDGVLTVMDAWNATCTEELAESSESFRDGYYHALVTMAEAIMDTGGRLKLAGPEHDSGQKADQSADQLADQLAEKILERLPEMARRESDRQLLADPVLKESLSQMREMQASGDLFPEVMPSRTEVEVAKKVTASARAGQDGSLMLKCTSCSEREGHEVKYPATEFWRDSKGSTGYKSKCKECARAVKKKAA
jgi:hypothetical protein